MSEILEVLFTSVNNSHASCSAHDLRTGIDLMKYKGGGTVQPHGLELLSSNYVIAANSTKPLLHVWPINGQEQMSTVRFVLPGKVNALALSPDGAFIVAGIQESIYIWHLTTGNMLNTLSKHYQPVTCLRFTEDGEHFASAGKDGAVLLWNLTNVVSPLDQSDNEANTPVYSFNDHGLAVTDLHIGCGGMRAYMYTVSLDRCCKVYDLSSGTMLLSVVFPVALHSVLVNGLESNVFVGGSDGQIYVFHMERVPRMKEYHLEEHKTLCFSGHTAGQPITCLALSLNGQQLISAGEDKKVCVWHVSSRQLIKSIPQNGTVTNLKVRLTNPAIFQPEHKQPQLFANSLKRMITTTAPDDDDECIELLITEVHNRCQTPELDLNKICDTVAAQKGVTEEVEEEVAESSVTTEVPEKETSSDEESNTIENSKEENHKKSSKTTEAAVKRRLNEEVDETPTTSLQNTENLDVAELIAENRRLKRKIKSMFKVTFEYIASQPDKPSLKSPKTNKKARKD